MSTRPKPGILTWTLLMVAFAALPVWADNKQQATTARTARTAGSSTAYHARTSDPFQKLDKPIELPGVPHFNGDAKFQFGLLRSNYDHKGGTSVALRYSTHNTAEDVIKFYYDILPKYRWTLKSTTDKQLSASLQGNILSVKIMPRSAREYKTDFYLSCEMPRR